MFALGLTDLLVVSLRLSIRIMLRVKYQWTDLVCKVLYYHVNVAYRFSNWILVSWTLEQSIAVIFPLKLNAWYSNRKVGTILSLPIIINACLLVSQLIEVSSINTSNGLMVCIYSKYYYVAYAMIEHCFICISRLYLWFSAISLLFQK